MNLHTIAGHSFDLDRLPDKPFVLDVGCRGFDFTKGIRELRPQAWIWAMDPDPTITKPDEALCAFLNLALVAPGARRRQRYATGSTGEGNYLTDMESHPDWKIIEVDCASMNMVTSLLPPKYQQNGPITENIQSNVWDLVKLDAEGSEFAILEHWPGPIARQISVEFHDWHGTHIPTPSGDWDSYYKGLFAHLSEFGYDVARHELSDISGRGAFGHWDSVLVLR